ncbi:MAG: DUF1080 domain-containing protein [Planctomycetaceae bacterium]|nr:DUF1080 domain-containing protein [Planctomycetaceae bacterium]
MAIRSLSAAEGDAQQVYTDPANVDGDYAFQGEYRGYQRSRPSTRSSEPIGLQVIALGNGEFAAVKYYGGLPGAGWRGDERFPYHGRRIDGMAILRGGQYDVELDGQIARIRTYDGREAGLLQKVERISPTMGAQPPQGAFVLFNGTNTEHFKNAKMTEDGLLLAGTETVAAWDDFRLHAEFRIPYKPLARGQNRGNSGFYLQSRYEVQVLDSFGLEGVENECGALYKTKRPDLNMCLPPLTWQTYDIDFTSPKFSTTGEKIRDMQITVWHNGVKIHDHARIPNKTGAGKPEAPIPLTTKLQDHGNPVVYRNIWIVPKDGSVPLTANWVKLPLKAPPVPVQAWAPPLPIVIGVHGGVTFGPYCP